MFDAYSIAIKLSMVNGVSPALSLISSQFAKANVQADLFAAKLKSIKSLAIVGGTLFAAGAIGLAVGAHFLKPALEYQRQLNTLRMAGLTQVEINEAISDSWANTSKNLTTSAAGNLKTLLDLRNVMADFQNARVLMPIVTDIQTALNSTAAGQALGKSSDLATSMGRALATVGANKSKEEFAKEANMMAQTIIATQGGITPQMYQMVFNRAAQDRYSLSDEYKYRYLPTLMLENSRGNRGAGMVGTMLRQAMQWGAAGSINRMSLQMAGQLGLVDPNSAISTTTQQTTAPPVKGAALLMSDSFAWFEQILKPALFAKYGNISKEQMDIKITELFRGQQQLTSMMTEYYNKEDLFKKNADLYTRALTGRQAYLAALMGDPGTAYAALQKQIVNVETAMAIPISGIVIPALVLLSEAFGWLKDKLLAMPGLAQTLSVAFFGLSTSLLFGGIVLLLTAGFKGLALSLGLFRFLPVLTTGFWGLALAMSANLVPILGVAAGLIVVAGSMYYLYKQLSHPGFVQGLVSFNAFMNKMLTYITQFFRIIGDFVALQAGDLAAGKDMTVAWNNIKGAGLNVPKVGVDKDHHVHVYVTNSMDGNYIAAAVTKAIVKSASRVPHYQSRFDTTAHPVPVGANLRTAG